MRIWSNNIILYILKITGLYYKSPANLNYWWNFGFLALFFLISQIISGIILGMFYLPVPELAYVLVYQLTNETFYGWWLRYVHANGSSFFFFVVYVHMARGFYYGSYLYPRQSLWISGVIIWILMVATAFLGYILPWGQMSFWAAMVITSLLGSIPFIGPDLIYLLWGSFSVSGATLTRFYSLHFALPFVILFVTLLHLTLLHEHGSNNPLGILNILDHVPFVPYYSVKDTFSLVFIIMVFVYIIVCAPDILGHPDNFILANPLVTPPHIVPEWYFLPLYAVLRSIPNKSLGLLALVLFIIVLLMVPFINKNAIIRSSMNRPFIAILNWIFFAVVLLLGWIGSLPIISPYYEMGQIFTALYFIVLLVLFPLVNYFESLVYKAYAQNHIEAVCLLEQEDHFSDFTNISFEDELFADIIVIIALEQLEIINEVEYKKFVDGMAYSLKHCDRKVAIDLTYNMLSTGKAWYTGNSIII